MIIRSIYRQSGFLNRLLRFFPVRPILLSAALCLLLSSGLWLTNRNCTHTPLIVAYVKVSGNDTVWSIAKKYGDPNEYILARVTEITRMNGLGRDYVLRQGQILVVPVCNGDTRELNGGRYAKREISN